MSKKCLNSFSEGVSSRTSLVRSTRSRVSWGAVAMFFSLLALCWPSNADAEFVLTHVDFWDDGTWDSLYKDDETGDVVVFYGCEKYGETGFSCSGYYVISGNPDPTEGSDTGGTDIKDLINQLKNLGGPGEYAPPLSKTPLGKHLAKIGKGMIDPFHNPSGDVSNGESGGSSPFGDPLDGNGAGGGSGGGGSGMDPNGGSLGEQIRNNGKKGNKGSGDGSSGSDPPGPKGEELPAPPEIVNPPWDNVGFVLVSPLGSSRGARAGRVATARAARPANAAFQLGAFGLGGASRIGARPTAALAGGR